MSRVLGTEVRNRSGQKIGDLQDLVVDSQGKLMLAIVSTGGWLGLNGRLHAVPWEVLRTASDGTRVLDLERAHLSRVPGFSGPTSATSDGRRKTGATSACSGGCHSVGVALRRGLSSERRVGTGR